MPDIFKLGKLKAVESREKKRMDNLGRQRFQKGKKEKTKGKYKVEVRIKGTRVVMKSNRRADGRDRKIRDAKEMQMEEGTVERLAKSEEEREIKKGEI